MQLESSISPEPSDAMSMRQCLDIHPKLPTGPDEMTLEPQISLADFLYKLTPTRLIVVDGTFASSIVRAINKRIASINRQSSHGGQAMALVINYRH